MDCHKLFTNLSHLYRAFISDRNCFHLSSKYFTKNSKHHVPFQGQKTLQPETAECQILPVDYVTTKFNSTPVIRRTEVYSSYSPESKSLMF